MSRLRSFVKSVAVTETIHDNWIVKLVLCTQTHTHRHTPAHMRLKLKIISKMEKRFRWTVKSMWALPFHQNGWNFVVSPPRLLLLSKLTQTHAQPNHGPIIEFFLLAIQNRYTFSIIILMHECKNRVFAWTRWTFMFGILFSVLALVVDLQRYWSMGPDYYIFLLVHLQS